MLNNTYKHLVAVSYSLVIGANSKFNRDNVCKFAHTHTQYHVDEGDTVKKVIEIISSGDKFFCLRGRDFMQVATTTKLVTSTTAMES